MEIDLVRLAEEAIELVGREARNHQIVIRVHAARPVTLWSDPYQLRQVLINLLSNAIQAIDKNGTIDVTVEDARGMLTLAVADTGAGIPSENLLHVFEPFFSTKDPGEGTGLGLFVSRGIIERLGGKIDVVSRLGHGTRFCITLPQCPSNDGPLSVNRRPDQKPSKEVKPMIKIPTRILIVDDEHDFVDMLSLRLGEVGESVSSAYNGREGLETLARKEIDVVILDIKMPGMDGIQTLQEIKKRYPLTEVIMLTGHGSTETAVKGMKLGAFDYLLKPADFNDLQLKLENARKRKDEQGRAHPQSRS